MEGGAAEEWRLNSGLENDSYGIVGGTLGVGGLEDCGTRACGIYRRSMSGSIADCLYCTLPLVLCSACDTIIIEQ